jgi:hypothetical protein
MNTRNRTILPAIVGAVLLLALATLPARAQEAREVWAYYLGWYLWDSWNDDRLIDRPQNLYDVRDAGSLGAQIDQARGAGIDAFIMSYFGPKDGNLTHQVFNALLDQAGGRGFRVAASVDLGDPYYHATLDEVKDTLRYLIHDRANHGAYLRYQGRPVIYFWNQGRYSAADWRAVRDEIDPNHATLWIAEGTSTALIPTFDGLYLFNTAWAGNPAATAQRYSNAVRAAGGDFYSPTALPGWDESRIAGRTNPTSPRDRAGGQFLRNSWQGAISAGRDVILIVSWNEYFENSHIEPSQLYGSQALDTLRPLIAEWKAGAASAAPEAPSDVPAFTANANLRLRAGPSTDTDVLGSVAYGRAVQAIGRSADNAWVQVVVDGQTGWLSAAYGSLSVAFDSLPVAG